MTTNDSFDRTLETWLRGQAPKQAPDRVLDAALERVETAPQGRGWLRRFLGGTAMTSTARATAVAAAIVIAVVFSIQLTQPPINIGPSPNPSPSAAPTASPAPSLPLASAAPTPTSKPGPAALVMELYGSGEFGWTHLVTLLDDGRLVTSKPNGTIAPMVRRLTSAGIQLVRDEMDATGLTDSSASYQPIPNPGIEDPGYDSGQSRLTIIQPGGERVVVSWYLFGDTPEDYFQPQPEAEALEALVVRLSTLETWLPATAWVDSVATPYVPDSYLMTINGSEWGGGADRLPVEAAQVSWPPDVDKTNLDKVLDASGDANECGPVDAADGTAILAALRAAGATPQDGTNLSYGLGERATTRIITITLAPIMPFDDGEVGPRC